MNVNQLPYNIDAIINVLMSLGLFWFCPQMSTMPGLPTRPCFYDIDLDPVTEEITGLFWARSHPTHSHGVCISATFKLSEGAGVVSLWIFYLSYCWYFIHSQPLYTLLLFIYLFSSQAPSSVLGTHPPLLLLPAPFDRKWFHTLPSKSPNTPQVTVATDYWSIS